MATRFVQYVLKISKLCNLRCRYCYEFEFLSDKTSMSAESLDRLFHNVRDYHVARDAEDGQKTEVRFIWHGGEPLLQKPAFYRQVLASQREIFGDDLSARHSVQTNLTRLDDDRLALLRDDFDEVGVSLDVFGGLRQQLNGADSQTKVLANLDKLRKSGVNFGCITVLNRRNIGDIERIYNFYEAAGISFRVLPLFDTPTEGQNEALEITTDELVAAFQQLTELWLSRPKPIRVAPLEDYMRIAVRHLSPGAPQHRFDKRFWTPTVLVDTDGSCFSYGDPYGEEAWSLGNIFSDPMSDILGSERWDQSAQAAEVRMAKSCVQCPLWGACDGYAIAEDHNNCREKDVDGDPICTFERTFITWLVARLEATGVVTSAA